MSSDVRKIIMGLIDWLPCLLDRFPVHLGYNN
jgi:hypothetical protein